MANHLKRTVYSQSATVSSHGGARTVFWRTPAPGRAVLETQTYHNPRQHVSPLQSIDPLIPPLHWHWQQVEYFKVTAGRFIFTLEGTDTTVSPTTNLGHGEGIIRIPAKARHTFRVDGTCEEDCVVEISAEPGEQSGISERFFRNIYGYLDDCEEQKVAPSLPQVLLFLDSAEVSVGIPGPALVSQWVSYALGVVVGRWFGGYILGYRSSYEEYYDVKMAKKA